MTGTGGYSNTRQYQAASLRRSYRIQAVSTTHQTQKGASERAFALKHYPPRLLASDKTVAKMIDGSRATVWRRVKDRTLPQPIKVGGLTRWVVSEVQEAIEKRIAMRDQGEAT